MFTVVMTNGIEDRGSDVHFNSLHDAAVHIANEVCKVWNVQISMNSIVAAVKQDKRLSDPTTPGWGWHIIETPSAGVPSIPHDSPLCSCNGMEGKRPLREGFHDEDCDVVTMHHAGELPAVPAPAEPIASSLGRTFI